jgi:hypothetical protein
MGTNLSHLRPSSARQQIIAMPEQPATGELLRERRDAAVEPSRPSAAVADNTQRRRLTGDLDRITLKAVAADQSQRYASARALRDDVGRHLAGLPIHARPASPGYRLARYARRHRAIGRTRARRTSGRSKSSPPCHDLRRDGGCRPVDRQAAGGQYPFRQRDCGGFPRSVRVYGASRFSRFLFSELRLTGLAIAQT